MSGTAVRCEVCPKGCSIPEGAAGACNARVNRNGRITAKYYGRVSSIAIDPIEKKPLYHFHPGKSILSVGTVGCNLTCSFCQNWQISQREAETYKLYPEQLAELAYEAAREQNSVGVAYTYSEPVVWYEYVLDSAQAVKGKGLVNVLVTNGTISSKPLDRMLPYIDAVNIDVKAFTDKFYDEQCGGRLEWVKRTVEALAGKVHIEITSLIIPDLNDSNDEIKGMCKWISSINPDIPLHLSRYFPRHLLKKPPTPIETLFKAREIAGDYLRFVYIGNTDLDDVSDTICPKCGQSLIKRSYYSVAVAGLDSQGFCKVCGYESSIVF